MSNEQLRTLFYLPGDEKDDDPENSGIHVDDSKNIPDSQGRVLVNVGHPSSDPDVFLSPQVARAIKPHQVGREIHIYFNLFIIKSIAAKIKDQTHLD